MPLVWRPQGDCRWGGWETASCKVVLMKTSGEGFSHFTSKLMDIFVIYIYIYRYTHTHKFLVIYIHNLAATETIVWEFILCFLEWYVFCCVFFKNAFGSSGVSTPRVSFKMTIFGFRIDAGMTHWLSPSQSRAGTDQASRSIEEAAECHGTDWGVEKRWFLLRFFSCSNGGCVRPQN